MPGGFSVSGPTSSGAALTWNTQLFATGHQIERRGDDGSQATFAAATAGSHTDTIASPDTSYEYRSPQ